LGGTRVSMTGGDILLNCLESYDIEYIFCSPGTEWAPVWEALAKRTVDNNRALKYINCRHETLAVSMAQGYYESSGRMAAVLLHSGVGALNGALAIRTAYFAKSPMLIISGETYQHSENGQTRPQGGHWLSLLSDIGGPSLLVKDYVKWSNSIRTKDGMVDAVSRGIRIAASPIPGPVFLTVSPELLAGIFPDQTIRRPFLSPIKFELPIKGLEEAARWLLAGSNPIIMTEYAGKNPNSIKALVELAELLSLPVFDVFASTGNFPKNHPLYLGHDARQALNRADVVLIVGSSLPWYPPSICFRENIKVILLDDDSLHENIPHWGYRIDLSLTTDIEKGLVTLVDILKARLTGKGSLKPAYSERLSFWNAKHEKMMDDWKREALAEEKTLPISALWFLQQVHELLPDNTLYVDETIMHSRSVHQYLAGESNYFRPSYGGLGVGFGEAIGVKLANPGRPVVLVIGDGSFSYNPVLAGFGLCQEYNIPIFIILLNNGGYMAMKSGHVDLFPQGAAVSSQTFFGVDITPTPDYSKIAQAFNAYAEKIERPSEIAGALRRGLTEMAAGKTVMLDVVMN
jgi:acetolactate synthase I/II/III large subunit